MIESTRAPRCLAESPVLCPSLPSATDSCFSLRGRIQLCKVGPPVQDHTAQLTASSSPPHPVPLRAPRHPPPRHRTEDRRWAPSTSLPPHGECQARACQRKPSAEAGGLLSPTGLPSGPSSGLYLLALLGEMRNPPLLPREQSGEARMALGFDLLFLGRLQHTSILDEVPPSDLTPTPARRLLYPPRCEYVTQKGHGE